MERADEDAYKVPERKRETITCWDEKYGGRSWTSFLLCTLKRHEHKTKQQEHVGDSCSN